MEHHCDAWIHSTRCIYNGSGAYQRDTHSSLELLFHILSSLALWLYRLGDQVQHRRFILDHVWDWTLEFELKTSASTTTIYSTAAYLLHPSFFV